MRRQQIQTYSENTAFQALCAGLSAASRVLSFHTPLSAPLTGLIDYNFHCFKKAIQEVFDVRVKLQQNRKLLSQRRWSKLTAANGAGLNNPH